MQARAALRPFERPDHVLHAQAGGIRCDDRIGAYPRLDVAPEPVLELEVLEDRLDDEVGSLPRHRIVRLVKPDAALGGAGFQAPELLVPIAGGALAHRRIGFGDFALPAVARKCNGDVGAHAAGAEDHYGAGTFTRPW